MSQTNAAVLGAGTDYAWRALLDAHDVQFIVLDVQLDRGWQQAMKDQPGWMVDVEDEQTVLYARARVAEGDHV